MLVPVIEKWALLSSNRGERAGLIVTIFSDSARGAIQKLSTQLQASGARLLFAGYAPWEGDWMDALTALKPDFVVTARYEAWPELWMSLAQLEIPLLVVGAKARTSLKWARRACEWAGVSLPEILFCTVGDEDIAQLKAQFPQATTAAAGDPRWERVVQRAKAGNSRAKELVELNRSLSRPWGVLGSCWIEDLHVWKNCLSDRLFTGTLWIVPHRIEEPYVVEMETFLSKLGVKYKRSQSVTSNTTVVSDCIIVNEMGFLTELYQAADWAYIGGGFGVSVHNTIEPAIHGIPVACGPKRADRFPEIQILSNSQQLQVVRNANELGNWLRECANSAQKDPARKQKWIDQAGLRLGASDTILKLLSSRVSGWKLQKEHGNF
jgi:3-deoxy-D-manno-octulosonic-acid transferase